jgi:hypothetical protein
MKAKSKMIRTATSSSCLFVMFILGEMSIAASTNVDVSG